MTATTTALQLTKHFCVFKCHGKDMLQNHVEWQCEDMCQISISSKILVKLFVMFFECFYNISSHENAHIRNALFVFNMLQCVSIIIAKWNSDFTAESENVHGTMTCCTFDASVINTIRQLHACRCFWDEAPSFEVRTSTISYVPIGYQELC